MNIEEILLDIQSKTNETNTTVLLMKKDFEVVQELADKHEKIIFGDPEKMGEGGIVACLADHKLKIEGVGKRIDSIRSLFAPLWTAIVAIVAASISGIFNFIIKVKGGH